MNWPEILGGVIGGVIITLSAKPLVRIAAKLKGVKAPPKR